ncbi:MAG: aminotransferase class III-fold pyridoxal phosphate-dependent enzyme, partial [Rhodothermales bacterium]
MTTVKPHTSSATFERVESQVRSYSRSFPIVFDKALGATIYDTEGRAYTDFLAGCSTLNYGHNDPDLKQALIEYVSADGIAHGLDMFTDAKERFLESFERIVLKPRGMDYRLQFTGPTGANAVEAAIKLARKVTGRDTVVAFTNGFHGVTLGALAATGNSKHRMGAGRPLSGVARAAYDNYFGAEIDTASMLDQQLSDASSGFDAPAAIIVETVQGEGGLNAASAEWLRKIEAIARRHGALFIIDDIQAGIGRTGGFFS